MRYKRHRSTVRRRGLTAYVLLAALLLRAYIPEGFMPASGTPFLLELCPAAMAMPMSMPMPMPMSMPMPAGHHHDSNGHSHFDNCPFGSVSIAGPLPSLPPLGLAARIDTRCILGTAERVVTARFERAHAARGPPLSRNA